MSSWKRVAENLVRHESGTIYLRAKVAGKPIRYSLKTIDLAAAKRKRDKDITHLQKQAANTAKAEPTLGKALAAVEKELIADPRLKPRTVEYYQELHQVLRDTLPVKHNPRHWTAEQAREWWVTIAARFSPQRANNLLAQAKKLGTYLQDNGQLVNPTAKLRRVRIIKREPFSPSKEQIAAIAASIRSQRKASSKASAAYVEFLAFSGCRHGEAKGARWEDLDPSWTWLTITGGEQGTKNMLRRDLPVSGPLKAALLALHYPEASGPILLIHSPKDALQNALTRLKLPHLRIHDLRHFFATWCIERGVEIPTVARWLGHQDGGALLLRTYGHLRAQHSLDSAKKLDD